MLSSSVDLDDNPKIKEQCGDIKFASWTVRLYKLHNLRSGPNVDLGEKATYKGGIQDHDEKFKFDEFYTFNKGETFSVCANTAEILRKSRFAPFFTVSEPKTHIAQTTAGPFILTQSSGGGCCPSKDEPAEASGSGCC